MGLIRREESLLLVIDVQEGFYPEARTDVDRKSFAQFIDRVAWVTGLADTLGVPVVVTEEEPEENGPTSPRVARRSPPGAQTFPKPVFAAGDNPPILAAIEAAGRPSIVLAGMETDVCVAHSAISLLDRGHRVVAVTDALFSPGAAHSHGLARLRETGTEMVSAKALFYDWTRTVHDVVALLRDNNELATPPGFSL